MAVEGTTDEEIGGLDEEIVDTILGIDEGFEMAEDSGTDRDAIEETGEDAFGHTFRLR